MAIRHLLQTVSRGLTIVGVAAGGLLAALLAGPSTGPVVAVFPPWWDGTHAVRAAATGGSILSIGVLNFVIVVAPGGTTGRNQLWRAGAWLLLNPSSLVGCAVTTGVVGFAKPTTG